MSQNVGGEALPPGWEIASLGEVTVDKVRQGAPGRTGVTYVDISAIDRTAKRITETTTVNVDTAPTRARQWLEPGDVLVSMTRPNLNAVAMVPDTLAGAIASTGFDVLRTMEVLPEWIFYRVCTQAFVTDVCESLQGVVYPAIRPHDIRRHRLPIPPLAEQRRIIEVIETHFTRLDAILGTLTRVQANLRRFRSSVQRAAVEGLLVPTEADLARIEEREYEPASHLLNRILDKRRLRYEETESEKMTGRGTPKSFTPTTIPYKLPEGWCWTNIEALSQHHRGSICAGPFGTIFKAKDFRSHGIPIIFLRHVKAGRFLTQKPTYMDAGKWENIFRPYSVFGGELLITKLGDPPGECAIYPHGVGPSMLTPDIMKVEVDDGLISPIYLMHYLNSNTVRLLAFGAAFGTTRLRLTLPIFRNIPVPLPPLKEQKRILDSVGSSFSLGDKTEETIRAIFRRVGRLRQSILGWAFEGKLVDQNPRDEPAFALLERIRTERPSREPKKRESLHSRRPKNPRDKRRAAHGTESPS